MTPLIVIERGELTCWVLSAFLFGVIAGAICVGLFVLDRVTRVKAD